MSNQDSSPRVAFVSTRIAGTDGVSLEIAKWADVLERWGVECYYFAGEVDRPKYPYLPVYLWELWWEAM